MELSLKTKIFRVFVLFTLLVSLTAQSIPVAYWVTCTDAGTTDGYACTPSPAAVSGSYPVGLRVRLYAATANTDGATLNINGVGDIPIKNINRGLTADPVTGDIKAGTFIDLTYDGTNFQYAGPSSSSGGGAYILTSNAGTAPAANTYYQALSGSLSWATATDGTRVTVMPHAGTVKTIGVRLSSGSITGDMVFTLRKNGVDQPLVLTIPSGSAIPGYYSASTDVSFVAGDYLSWKLVTPGGGTIASVSTLIN